jgi:hypothetical protein
VRLDEGCFHEQENILPIRPGGRKRDAG